MLNVEKVIARVMDSCEYPCKALKHIPKETLQYQTETKPEIAGTFFNADVIQNAKQKILVMRENLTSYTDAMLIPSEQKQALSD